MLLMAVNGDRGQNMNKKASSNMWWIIIGAVIALVVMIVLMVMFTGKTKPLEEGLSDCGSKGGICVPGGAECPERTLSSSTFSCTEGRQCCVGVPLDCSDNPTKCQAPRTCLFYDSVGKSYCT